MIRFMGIITRLFEEHDGTVPVKHNVLLRSIKLRFLGIITAVFEEHNATTSEIFSDLHQRSTSESTSENYILDLYQGGFLCTIPSVAESRQGLYCHASLHALVPNI